MLRSLGSISRLPRRFVALTGVSESQSTRFASDTATCASNEALTCSRSQGTTGSYQKTHLPGSSTASLEICVHISRCYADGSLQYHGETSNGSSTVSEQDTIHHQGPSWHHAGSVQHLREHARSQSHHSHSYQHSHQPTGCVAHTCRGFSSSSRATHQSAANHHRSRREHGIASLYAVAALRLEQGPAGSSSCSTRGFASMPDTALHRDTQHDTGSATQGERAFASASEPAQQSAAPAAEPAQQPFIPPGRIQNAPAPPWTPTRELRKRNFLPRRMGHLMEVRPPACFLLFIA